jgi:hypothetical protein
MVIKTEYPKHNWSKITTELSTFKLDKQDGKGFDMDLLSIDTIYWHGRYVDYASRRAIVKANWLTTLLQKWFGVNS